MTSHLITGNPSTTISQVIEIMNTNKIRRLPVVDKGDRLVGIISEKDILKAIDKSKKD